jgi:hypothetical protein
MTTRSALSEGKELIQTALKLNIPTDDLLTIDGEEVAWTALRDFKVPINGVLIEFHKGDPVREWYLINELRNSRCPVASLEPELRRRVTYAHATKTRQEMLMLKPNFHGIGIDLKELTRRVRACFARWRGEWP